MDDRTSDAESLKRALGLPPFWVVAAGWLVVSSFLVLIVGSFAAAAGRVGPVGLRQLCRVLSLLSLVLAGLFSFGVPDKRCKVSGGLALLTLLSAALNYTGSQAMPFVTGIFGPFGEPRATIFFSLLGFACLAYSLGRISVLVRSPKLVGSFRQVTWLFLGGSVAMLPLPGFPLGLILQMHVLLVIVLSLLGPLRFWRLAMQLQAQLNRPNGTSDVAPAL